MTHRTHLSRLCVACCSICAVAIVAIITLSVLRTVGLGTPKTPVPSQAHIEDSAGSFLSRLPLFPYRDKQKQLIALIIENHEDARPHQRGLNDALFIAEFLVEGFISRFAAIFSLDDLPQEIGPLRSLRPYFTDAVAPWTSALLFAGGSPEALDQVQRTPEIAYMNVLALSESQTLRKDGVPAPHDLFITHEQLRKLAEEMLITQNTFPPYLVGPSESKEGAKVIRLNFLNPMHNVTYAFNPFFSSYTRTNGDIVSDAHPKNLLILEAPIESIGEYGRLHIPLEQGGRALLFRGGTITQGHWGHARNESSVSSVSQGDGEEKDSGSLPLPPPFTFTDSSGNPLRFARGQTWMTVLPTLERVEWGEEVKEDS
jgi:hypothetical protein